MVSQREREEYVYIYILCIGKLAFQSIYEDICSHYDGEQAVANTAGSIQFLRGFDACIYLRMGAFLLHMPY